MCSGSVWLVALERPFSSWLRNTPHRGRVLSHPPGEGQLGRFQFLAGVTDAALNTHVQVRVWARTFVSLERIPREESLGRRVMVCFSN